LTARYLRQEYCPARQWKLQELKSWLEWAIANGFLLRILDDDKHILGVAIARPIMNALDGHRPLMFDPEGTIIFMDMCVTTHPMAVFGLAALIRRRFGFREHVGWMRHAKLAGGRTDTRKYADNNEWFVRLYSYRRMFDKIFGPQQIERLTGREL
jgi:hypothetical protein